MNYKLLLKKYIEHVGEREGISFISTNYIPDGFTIDEWKELIYLDSIEDISALSLTGLEQ